jgi:hypothetical protein
MNRCKHHLPAKAYSAKEGSRIVPSWGQWKHVPGEVQIRGSHPIICGIRVNTAIFNLDIAGSSNVDTSSLQKKSQGRFQETTFKRTLTLTLTLSRGDGGRFQERFKEWIPTYRAEFE